jgi:SAM-dependent methyltransferase
MFPILFRLFTFSFLILYFELALIRYLAANLQAFSFFINLVILATFLGMGVGLLLEKQEQRLTLSFPLLLLALVLVVKYFANVNIIVQNRNDEPLWSIPVGMAPHVQQFGLETVVVIIFFLGAILFIPLGHALGRYFRQFPALTAYSVNVAGSLAGIIAFAVMSYFSTSPLLWFLSGILMFLLASGGKPKRIAFDIGLSLAALGVIYSMTMKTGEMWSPYYKVNYISSFEGPVTTVTVNDSLHQLMVDFSTEATSQGGFNAKIKKDYLLPYQYVNKLEEVLILGAGTGNDVVLVLEQGAGHIDAVEIDPVIIRLGRERHYNRPYDSTKVTVHVNDARAFLKQTPKQYDLIITGTLDSQTLLSGMTSIRLDNYMYTVESFSDIKKRLKPGGVLVTYHMSPYPYIANKIHDLIFLTFGSPPKIETTELPRLFNYVFVAAKTNDTEPPLSIREQLFQRFGIPVDDWPYLYIKKPMIPTHYITVLFWIILISVIMIGMSGRPLSRKGTDPTLFFMGTGFLLLETKSVTEMSLLFGSTWVVNVLVFSAILLVILFANLVTIKTPKLNRNLLFILLFASLIMNYNLSVNYLLNIPTAFQWILGIILVGLPLFFAGIIFADIFRERKETTTSLAFNSIGAILGGTMEYSSMVLGMRKLYLLALLFYLLALLANRLEKNN